MYKIIKMLVTLAQAYRNLSQTFKYEFFLVMILLIVYLNFVFNN
jgi:hypothetical protein